MRRDHRERTNLNAVDEATSAPPPAGFETWLAEHCPDGASIQVGEPGRVVACERVREKAVADPALRDRLVEVYTSDGTLFRKR